MTRLVRGRAGRLLLAAETTVQARDAICDELEATPWWRFRMRYRLRRRAEVLRQEAIRLLRRTTVAANER